MRLLPPSRRALRARIQYLSTRVQELELEALTWPPVTLPWTTRCLWLGRGVTVRRSDDSRYVRISVDGGVALVDSTQAREMARALWAAAEAPND